MMFPWRVTLCAVAFTLGAAEAALAGQADVIRVSFERTGERLAFAVTIQHADEGWDHYADRFEIVALDGTVLAIRELTHPHVDEQPFTRSIGGVRIPEGIGGEITVRAHDSVHGFGGQEFVVKIRKAYACGVPVESGLTPPAPEPVSGRVRCPEHLPDR